MMLQSPSHTRVKAPVSTLLAANNLIVSGTEPAWVRLLTIVLDVGER